MKFEIAIRHLLAVNIFASTEETRYYLNGVQVKREKNVLSMCATDGHRLARIKSESKGADVEFIVPASLLKKIKPIKRPALTSNS